VDEPIHKYNGIKELIAEIDVSINTKMLDVSSVDIENLFKETFEVLTSQERDILNLRFLTGKQFTLQKIGNQYGFTRERIRQIIKNALRKLQHPARVKLLREKIIKIFLGETGLNSLMSHEITKLELEVRKLREKLDVKSTSVQDVQLSEIELSTRTTNCMRENKILTLGQLANMSIAQVFAIPNLGRKCFLELKEVLKSYGLNFKS